MQIGLIGAGRWGQRYIETIGRMSGISLAYLASGNPKSAALVPSGCRVTPRWRDLMEGDSCLDGIIIAAPPETHLEIATGAIRAGIPVLVEKPMTLSLPDAESLVKEAMDCGVLTMIGHTHLFSAAFRELKARGRSLGRLKNIRSAGGGWGPFRPDTPPLWDWAPHDLAMAIDLLGNYPIRIEVKRTGRIQQPKGIGEAVIIILGFESGARAEIHISNMQRHKQRVLEVTYEGGSQIYDDLAPHKLVFCSSSGSTPEPVIIEHSMPLANLVGEFCRAIGEGQHSHPSLRLGLQVVKALAECQAALDSAEGNKSTRSVG